MPFIIKSYFKKTNVIKIADSLCDHKLIYANSGKVPVFRVSQVNDGFLSVPTFWGHMQKAEGTRRGKSGSEEFKNKALGKRGGRTNRWVLPVRMKGDVTVDVCKSLKACGIGCRRSKKIL